MLLLLLMMMIAMVVMRATPLRRLWRALGIIPIANKTGNSLSLYSLLFHTPPLYTVQYIPWGLFFLFGAPPPPTRVCWGSGLG